MLYKISLREYQYGGLGLWIVIVPKLEGQHSFIVLPKRWNVERKFAWLMRFRRLVRDYGATVSSSKAWVRPALIDLLLGRVHP